jgi:hypothetical protein
MKTELAKMVELTDAELDAVAAAGHRDGHGSLIDADVIVRDNEIIKDVNVNANVLSGPSVIVQR